MNGIMRRPVTVECIGVEKRNNPHKHYLYILSVTWSDGLKHPIYRTYTAFFDFRACLKIDLQTRNGSAVSLPSLPPLKRFERSRYTAAEKRKSLIEEFCQQVLKLPITIVQSNTVVSFFQTWDFDFAQAEPLSDISDGYDKDIKRGRTKSAAADLRKTFRPVDEFHLAPVPKKSATIINRATTDECILLEPVLSDLTKAAKEKCLIKQASEEIPDEQYVVSVDYSAQAEGEVTLREGVIVDVLEKHLSGWWFVNIEGSDQQGWAPGSCLEPLLPVFNSLPQINLASEPEEPVCRLQATCDYTGQDEDEVSYKKGQQVEVIQANLDGWWKVRCNGKTGYTPATNLEKEQPLKEFILNPVTKNCNLLYHQSSIYRKNVPPPRRTSSSSMSDEVIYAKPNKGKQKVTYTDIVFNNEPNSKPKPVRRADPATEYTHIVPVPLPTRNTEAKVPEESEPSPPSRRVPPRTQPNYVNVEISSFKSADKSQTHPHTYVNVTLAEGSNKSSSGSPATDREIINKSAHAYVNIDIKPGQDTGQAIIIQSPGEVTFKLYTVLQNYKPDSTIKDGLHVIAGDTIEAEKEDGERCYCARRLSTGIVEKGWLPRSLLRVHDGETKVAGSPKSSQKKDINGGAIPKRRPQPLDLEKRDLLKNGQPQSGAAVKPLNLPPAPSTPSPKLPHGIEKPKSPGGFTSHNIVQALCDFSSPEVGVLSFRRGEEGTLLSKDGSGWWCVQIGHQSGWVPGNHWSEITMRPGVEGWLPGRLEDSPISAKAYSPRTPGQDSLVEMTGKHESHSWFVGKMSREEAIEVLTEKKVELGFLVRESMNRVGDFTLSVYNETRVRHFPIRTTPEGKYNIGKHDFKHMSKIISYYQKNPLFYDENQSAHSLGVPIVCQRR